ncbi:hypothetical protein EON66_00835, partial [archaeon]
MVTLTDVASLRLVLQDANRPTATYIWPAVSWLSSGNVAGSAHVALPAGRYNVSLEWLKSGTQVRGWRSSPAFLDGFAASRTLAVFVQQPGGTLPYSMLPLGTSPGTAALPPMAWMAVRDSLSTLSVRPVANRTVFYFTLEAAVMLPASVVHNSLLPFIQSASTGKLRVRFMLDHVAVTTSQALMLDFLAASTAGTYVAVAPPMRTLLKVSAGSHVAHLQWQCDACSAGEEAALRHVLMHNATAQSAFTETATSNAHPKWLLPAHYQTQFDIVSTDGGIALGAVYNVGMREGATLTLPGIHARDADALIEPELWVTANLSVLHGQLHITYTTSELHILATDASGGVMVDPSSSSSSSSSHHDNGAPRTATGAHLQLRGSLTSINAALQSLTYTPAPLFNMLDTLHLWLEDEGSPAGGSPSASHSASIHIFVQPVNDAPLLDAPLNLSTWEDVPLALSRLAVRDLDEADVTLDGQRVNTTFSVQLSVTAGKLCTPPDVATQLIQDPSFGARIAAAVLVQSPVCAASLLLTGAAGDVRSALPSVWFSPPPNKNVHSLPNVTLFIHVSDMGGHGLVVDLDGRAVPGELTASAAIPIFIQPVNDAPLLFLPAVTSLQWSGWYIDADPLHDEPNANASVYDLTVCARSERAALLVQARNSSILSTVAATSATITDTCAACVACCTMRGTPSTLTNALSTLTYVRAASAAGGDSILLQLARGSGHVVSRRSIHVVLHTDGHMLPRVSALMQLSAFACPSALEASIMVWRPGLTATSAQELFCDARGELFPATLVSSAPDGFHHTLNCTLPAHLLCPSDGSTVLDVRVSDGDTWWSENTVPVHLQPNVTAHLVRPLTGLLLANETLLVHVDPGLPRDMHVHVTVDTTDDAGVHLRAASLLCVKASLQRYACDVDLTHFLPDTFDHAAFTRSAHLTLHIEGNRVPLAQHLALLPLPRLAAIVQPVILLDDATLPPQVAVALVPGWSAHCAATVSCACLFSADASAAEDTSPEASPLLTRLHMTNTTFGSCAIPQKAQPSAWRLQLGAWSSTGRLFVNDVPTTQAQAALSSVLLANTPRMGAIGTSLMSAAGGSVLHFSGQHVLANVQHVLGSALVCVFVTGAGRQVTLAIATSSTSGYCSTPPLPNVTTDCQTTFVGLALEAHVARVTTGAQLVAVPLMHVLNTLPSSVPASAGNHVYLLLSARLPTLRDNVTCMYTGGDTTSGFVASQDAIVCTLPQSAARMNASVLQVTPYLGTLALTRLPANVTVYAVPNVTAGCAAPSIGVPDIITPLPPSGMRGVCHTVWVCAPELA